MHAQERFGSHIVQARADRVFRSGQSFFEVHASALVRATPQQAWRVLTDYERLPEFVPDLVSAQVASRSGHEVVLEQQSTTGVLFLTQTIRMLVKIEEQPYSGIDVTLISGDMRHYSAHWTLDSFMLDGGEGTHVRFSGQMEPEMYIPALIGSPIMLISIRKMVEAVAAEIERRHAH